MAADLACNTHTDVAILIYAMFNKVSMHQGYALCNDTLRLMHSVRMTPGQTKDQVNGKKST